MLTSSMCPWSTSAATKEHVSGLSFSTGAIDLSHTVYIIPLLSGFTLDRGSALTTDFSIGVALEIKSATSYDRIYRTTSTACVSWVKSYRLTYDQTAVQLTQQTYVDGQFMVGSAGVPSSYTAPQLTSPATYFAGVNNFSFSGSQTQFSFNTSTFTLTSTGYNFINISTINHR